MVDNVMGHPDDPRVIFLDQNTTYCPDSQEQRARFERMYERLEERRKLDHEAACRASNPKYGTGKRAKKKKPPLNAAQAEAYKQAFRQPQGAYDRGIVARY